MDIVILSGADFFSTGSAQATSCLTRELLNRNNRVLFLEDNLQKGSVNVPGLNVINTYQFNKEQKCCQEGKHIRSNHSDTTVYKSWWHSFDSTLTKDGIEVDKFNGLLDKWERNEEKICIVSCSKPNFIELGKVCKDRGYKLIYYYLDDWRAFQEGKDADWYNEKREEELFHLSDKIICTGRSLYLRAKQFNSESYMFPNAYDHRVFQDVKPSTDRRIRDGKKYGMFNICLAGWLDGSWIDWDLIEHLLVNLPNVGFNIIGSLPIYNKRNLDLLKRIRGIDTKESTFRKTVWNRCGKTRWEKKYKNLSFLGLMSHEKVPSYFKTQDIGIIPFKKGDLTKAVSPVKVFCYLAGGLRVVGVNDLVDIKGYPNVYLYEDKEDCLKIIQEVMNKEWTETNHFLSGHTWKKRVDLLEEIIRSK